MEIILLIDIHTQDQKIKFKFKKTYNSTSIPSIGMKIIDDLFAVAKKIIDIKIDYSRNQCFVTLEPREETSERLSGHIQEVAAMHHWVIEHHQ